MGIDINSNIKIEKIKKGNKNLITDVKGIKVGHVTLNSKNIKTGVTALLPHENNIFKEKVMAASYVINGFGKSVGLIQIDELGTLETPIILTNTLSVGTCTTALIKYMLKSNEDIGVTTGTVNPVVMECNDGYLNDIRGLHIKEEHVKEAIENASVDFKEGCIGAGMGMSCYELKGGIGSSSRVVDLDYKEYTVGSLVLTNLGLKGDLILDNKNIGENINTMDNYEKEKGSIIIIIATDIPLSERQLKRVAKRASVSLARTGSYLGNGSGDIVLAFTTANKVPHYKNSDILSFNMIHDDEIDKVFRAVVESVEESIISSMLHAITVVGRDGHIRKSINEYMK
ncbi:P1 family peptidase [Terrisporobacter petrolearius]|uniref:DmpA family aminopeptidase n=1 Tax=Terrisporobacter petrolearius TaxID=1460447 RepID=UPI001D15F906|nr:P1 family peptidase [Terrisporobacter petrolearius]MCC3863543.1 P1 family peptidase [Terrisporobacter petrolearius]